MRKFTSDYIYGVIDTIITNYSLKPESNYAFHVQVFDTYAYVTFTYPISEDENSEWIFKFIKGESLVKLCKNVLDTLEVINKYELKEN
jgi:hypothetical protein